jgi:hypothetical protein
MAAPTLHINRPDTIAIRRITQCPTENRRRRFAAFDALWYGPRWTCLGCGDSWGDGERLERPFKPRWREEAKARAKERWQTAVRCGGPEHSAWLKAELEADRAFMAQYERKESITPTPKES